MAARKQASAITTHCRFKLVRAGSEFEAEGDRQFVMEMITKFLGPDTGASEEVEAPRVGANRRDLAQGSGHASGKSMSIREFIRAYDVKKHTDLVVAFGYFIEKHMGQDSFTPADINGLYYEAKLENSNTSHMLIQNIKRGYVMEAKNFEGNRKRFVLTTSGEQFIETKRSELIA